MIVCLNDNSTEVKLDGPLNDKIVDNQKESKDLIFSNEFGRITDLKIGPDGYLYVLSSERNG
ncbi:MAG TPA: hypothetical protein VD710_10295 [Nitrososphaeraceae archaeon]|nr:hypothetical protein [Nitrososphaeraceae archaeon]